MNDIVLGDYTTVEFSEENVDSTNLPTVIETQYTNLSEVINTIAIGETVNVEAYVQIEGSTLEQVDLPNFGKRNKRDIHINDNETGISLTIWGDDKPIERNGTYKITELKVIFLKSIASFCSSQ